jgi:acyl-coenzyme A thioesterase PaaI-like protein
MSKEVPALEEMMRLLEARYGQDLARYRVPPPVFTAMRGEFVAFDSEQAVLSARFPVLQEWLNPYGIMQGGMLAAAIDNTIGPLSMLVAPPNVTRRMEIKYSRGAGQDLGYILVQARCVAQEGRWLTFSADARSPQADLLARVKSVHWILEAAGSKR